ncbi:hypothetical protein JH146_0619 [Methanocaldococcus bathoardescens]|uniref:Uncharacterized protein n=1 Tax=Methanocaldococcus bathoardescens TaxID=1301915 RepID=A0A076LG62_9EURY|nr:hypothetical protein JH146_0619 [Methanocaldococcus bathoardescens]
MLPPITLQKANAPTTPHINMAKAIVLANAMLYFWEITTIKVPITTVSKDSPIKTLDVPFLKDNLKPTNAEKLRAIIANNQTNVFILSPIIFYH